MKDNIKNSELIFIGDGKSDEIAAKKANIKYLNIEKNNLKGYLDFLHKLELRGIKILK